MPLLKALGVGNGVLINQSQDARHVEHNAWVIERLEFLEMAISRMSPLLVIPLQLNGFLGCARAGLELRSSRSSRRAVTCLCPCGIHRRRDRVQVRKKEPMPSSRLIWSSLRLARFSGRADLLGMSKPAAKRTMFSVSTSLDCQLVSPLVQSCSSCQDPEASWTPLDVEV